MTDHVDADARRSQPAYRAAVWLFRLAFVVAAAYVIAMATRGATIKRSLAGVVSSPLPLIWNQRHLLHALQEVESFYNGHRPHRALTHAAPLRPLPEPITEPAQIRHLDIHRRDRLNGILHEYQHAA